MKNLYRKIFKQSIRNRILLSVTIMAIIVFTGIGFFFYLPLPQIREELDSRMKVSQEEDKKIHELQSLLYEYGKNVSEYLENKTVSKKELVKISEVKVDEKFEEILKLPTNELQRSMFELAFKEWKKAKEITNDIIFGMERDLKK